MPRGQDSVSSLEKAGSLERIRTVARLFMAFSELPRSTRSFWRCDGGAGCRLLSGTLNGLVHGRAQVNQHAQRLTRRIFGMKHYFPGLADHAQSSRRLVGRKLCTTAIETINAALFELSETV